MRRNGHNSTSGIKTDIAVGSGIPENLYVHEISAKNAYLRVLLVICLLRMRRNVHSFTSGIKTDISVGLSVPENL